MKIEIYRRSDGLFAWRLVARNGRIIATDGGQGYTRRRAAERMVRKIVLRNFFTDVEVVNR